MIMSLAMSDAKDKELNPFFSEYNTPFGVPPFDKIKIEHYKPAIEAGIKEQQKEINAIVMKRSAPTFESIIEAMEKSGGLLDKVSTVFGNMTSCNTNKELQQIAKDLSPILSKHSDDIMLNKDLFNRVKSVYEQKETLKLKPEQKKLLEETYKNFVRSGANLNEKDQKRLREINEELSLLTLNFGQNILSENNEFKLIIDNQNDLQGLPQSVIDAATETANETGNKGKWVFTLQNPSFVPFMTYSAKRELREKMFRAYSKRGDNGNSFDNNNNIVKIINLRLEKSKLLGFKNYAEYVLEETMAKNPEKVNRFLMELWSFAGPNSEREANELQQLINHEAADIKVEAWDWRYYTERLRKQKYDIDEEQLRQYFPLEKVKQGIFQLVNLLYGLNFIERKDIPTYHTDATCYEVKKADNSHLGILYMDFHPRASKRGGAWMSNYRQQYKENGKNITPVVTIVCNFTKPTSEQPALLTIDEVETFFHEFGHALHGLLSDCEYKSLSGTSVPRDFVELPSQIMENWAMEPEVLSLYAMHYKTNEIIPPDLVEKIKNSSRFNQGFATAEYLAAAMLDMKYHTITQPVNIKPSEFEDTYLKSINLIPEIISRYKSTYFNHIFAGGYSAGYYSYIWSGVLDSDAFQAFKEKGLFDKNTADSFRKNILERGGTEDPMELYIKFRGREPNVEPLLQKRGLN
jgi:peptidyl-dipeptidase Dcp